MARTLDYVVRTTLKEDSVTRDVHEAESLTQTVTMYEHRLVKLDTTTTNSQITFSTNLGIPTRLFLQGSSGTFTYSVNTNARHHLVASGGFAGLHSSAITKLYLSNNSLTATPTVEVVLSG